MNAIPPAKPYATPDASRSAVEGIREQLSRFDRNAAEVAAGTNSESFAPGGRERALVEQTEIALAVRANARSLQVANQTLGTIIDIKV